MKVVQLQDRHVTYREIKTTLGISVTNILSMLHEHLTVKKIYSSWYGCLKVSQIQQRLLAQEALPNKLSPDFSENLDMSQSYH